VLPLSRGGQGQPFWYCLNPAFWLGTSKVQQAADEAIEEQLDPDVASVEKETKQQRNEWQGCAVKVLGMQKHFGHFQAVKGNWYTIKENELFCLLGPNGAGKSTSINVLTGILPITKGDAQYQVNKEIKTICDPQGMQEIRKAMGVCPQFDTTWDALTGREHLKMFATVKGLPPQAVTEWSEYLLRKVDLIKEVVTPKDVDPSNQRSGAYSGGMRRRLSVAIAMIGNPQMVYLDEPTTGMDPISRRKVWNTIEEFKEGRAIVLTTHSMEEADILGDTISIICKGRLRCIGTSVHLKQSKGAGYRVSVGVDPRVPQEMKEQQKGAIKHFFAQKQIQLIDETGSYSTFLIRQDRKHEMGAIFDELVKLKEQGQLPIDDLNLGMTTLEDVFLQIAMMAEATSASYDDTSPLRFLQREFVVKQKPKAGNPTISGEGVWKLVEGGKAEPHPELSEAELPPRIARLMINDGSGKSTDLLDSNGHPTFVQLTWSQDPESGKNLVEKAQPHVIQLNQPFVYASEIGEKKKGLFSRKPKNA
jgi:ABC-type multidrug transport system ATPase subunit